MVLEIYTMLLPLPLGAVGQGQRHDHRALFTLVLEKTPLLKKSFDHECRDYIIRAF